MSRDDTGDCKLTQETESLFLFDIQEQPHTVLGKLKRVLFEFNKVTLHVRQGKIVRGFEH